MNQYITLLSRLLGESLKDLGLQEKGLLLCFGFFRLLIWFKMINFSLIIIIRGRFAEH